MEQQRVGVLEVEGRLKQDEIRQINGQLEESLDHIVARENDQLRLTAKVHSQEEDLNDLQRLLEDFRSSLELRSLQTEKAHDEAMRLARELEEERLCVMRQQEEAKERSNELQTLQRYLRKRQVEVDFARDEMKCLLIELKESEALCVCRDQKLQDGDSSLEESMLTFHVKSEEISDFDNILKSTITELRNSIQSLCASLLVKNRDLKKSKEQLHVLQKRESELEDLVASMRRELAICSESLESKTAEINRLNETLHCKLNILEDCEREISCLHERVEKYNDDISTKAEKIKRLQDVDSYRAMQLGESHDEVEKLREKVEVCALSLEEKSNVIALLQSEREKQTALLLEKTEDVIELNHTLDGYASDLHTKSTEVDFLRNESERCKMLLKDREMELQHVTSTVDSKAGEVVLLNVQLNENKVLLEKNFLELERLRGAVDMLNTTVEEKNFEITELSSLLDSKHQEIDQLNTSLTVDACAFEELKVHHEAEKERNTRLTVEAKKAESRFAELIRSLEIEKDDFRHASKSKDNKISEMQNHIEHLEEAFDQYRLSQKLKQMESDEEISRLQRDLERSQYENSRGEQFSGEIERKKEEIDILVQKIERLNRTIEALKKYNKSLSLECKELTNTLQSTQKQNSSLSHQCKQLTLVADGKDEQIADLDESLALVTNKCEETMTQFDELMESSGERVVGLHGQIDFLESRCIAQEKKSVEVAMAMSKKENMISDLVDKVKTMQGDLEILMGQKEVMEIELIDTVSVNFSLREQQENTQRSLDSCLIEISHIKEEMEILEREKDILEREHCHTCTEYSEQIADYIEVSEENFARRERARENSFLLEKRDLECTAMRESDSNTSKVMELQQLVQLQIDQSQEIELSNNHTIVSKNREISHLRGKLEEVESILAQVKVRTEGKINSLYSRVKFLESELSTQLELARVPMGVSCDDNHLNSNNALGIMNEDAQYISHSSTSKNESFVALLEYSDQGVQVDIPIRYMEDEREQQFERELGELQQHSEKLEILVNKHREEIQGLNAQVQSLEEVNQDLKKTLNVTSCMEVYERSEGELLVRRTGHFSSWIDSKCPLEEKVSFLMGLVSSSESEIIELRKEISRLHGESYHMLADSAITTVVNCSKNVEDICKTVETEITADANPLSMDDQKDEVNRDELVDGK